jgi:two-component system, response regulator PdtaR
VLETVCLSSFPAGDASPYRVIPVVTQFTNDAMRIGPPFSILVVDDDAGSRTAIASVLADRGYAPVTVGSGEEAIEVARAETIHLAVFDHHMPRMTGLEALEQVRMFNALMPALLVTADPTREVIRLARQAQVYSVLPKPVNPNLFLHMLCRALTVSYGGKPE